MHPAQFLGKTFNFNIGKLTISPSYLSAVAIIFLLFLLLLVLAQVRRHFLDWSLKGGLFGIFFGFLLALIFEGFLLISGRTALTEVLGWKNPPKAIANVLDLGRNKLVKVMGVSSEIPASIAKNYSTQEVISAYQSLPPKDASKVKAVICNP